MFSFYWYHSSKFFDPFRRLYSVDSLSSWFNCGRAKYLLLRAEESSGGAKQLVVVTVCIGTGSFKSQALEQYLSESLSKVPVKNSIDDWIDCGVTIAHPEDEGLQSGRHIVAAWDTNGAQHIECKEWQPGPNERGHN